MKKIIGVFILICLILSEISVLAYTNFNADELVKNMGFKQAQAAKKLIDDLQKNDEKEDKNRVFGDILPYKGSHAYLMKDDDGIIRYVFVFDYSDKTFKLYKIDDKAKLIYSYDSWYASDFGSGAYVMWAKNKKGFTFCIGVHNFLPAMDENPEVDIYVKGSIDGDKVTATKEQTFSYKNGEVEFKVYPEKEYPPVYFYKHKYDKSQFEAGKASKEFEEKLKDDENDDLFKNLDKNQILRYKMAFGALSFHKNRLKKDNLKDSESEFIKSLLMFSSSLKFEDRELLYTSYRHSKEDDAFDFRVPSEIFIKTLKELFNIDFKDEYIKNINGIKISDGLISFKSDSPLNFVSTYTFITNVKKKGDYFIFKTDNLIQVFDYEDNIKNEFVNPYFILVKKDEKNGALQTLYCTGEDFDFEDAVNKYDIDIVNRYFTDDDISKINNENISSYISYIKERLGLKDFTENDKMASEDKEILKKICDGAEIKYMSVETAGNSVLLDNKFFKIYAKNYDDVSNFKRYLYSISSDEYFKKPVKVYIYSAEKDAEIYIDMMTVLLNNDFADIYILRKESGTAFNIALKEAIINCGSSIYVGEGDEPEINIFKDGKHIDGAKPFFSLQKAQESNGNIAKLSLENLRILEQKLVEDKDMRPYSVTKEKRKVYIIIACSVFIIIILFILIYIIRKRISSEEKKESRIVSADKMFDEEKK